MTDQGSFVHQFPLGSWDNFLYFIGDGATREVAVVDPAWDAQAIVDEAQRQDVTITHILCTHSHFDHVNQVEGLLKHVDVPVHMLGEEIDFASFKSENLTRRSPGDTLRIGQHVDIQFMHTPGHTPGSVCYRLRDGVVTGDTLFIQGCGRCDLVGGDPEAMYTTLRTMIDKLPLETIIYPGHDYGPTKTSTLMGELEENPYMQFPTLEGFVNHRMKGRTPNAPAPTSPD